MSNNYHKLYRIIFQRCVDKSTNWFIKDLADDKVFEARQGFEIIGDYQLESLYEERDGFLYYISTSQHVAGKPAFQIIRGE